jgi:hypothetical protein
MLKLARNAFATLRTLTSPDGVIRYYYIEDLVHVQDDMGLSLANKVDLNI